MKFATSLMHNIEQIVEEVKKDIPIIEKVIEKVIEEVKIIENVVEKIVDVIPVIEKDIATVEQIFTDVSIETDTIVEQEPVSSEQIYESSSDKLDLELIYPDYDDEILDDIPDDCPPIKKPPSFYKKPSSFKK